MGGRITLPSSPNLQNISLISDAVVFAGKFFATITVFDRAFGAYRKKIQCTRIIWKGKKVFNLPSNVVRPPPPHHWTFPPLQSDTIYKIHSLYLYNRLTLKCETTLIIPQSVRYTVLFSSRIQKDLPIRVDRKTNFIF